MLCAVLSGQSTSQELDVTRENALTIHVGRKSRVAKLKMIDWNWGGVLLRHLRPLFTSKFEAKQIFPNNSAGPCANILMTVSSLVLRVRTHKELYYPRFKF